jgi:hypothetical protein
MRIKNDTIRVSTTYHEWKRALTDKMREEKCKSVNEEILYLLASKDVLVLDIRQDSKLSERDRLIVGLLIEDMLAERRAKKEAVI